MRGRRTATPGPIAADELTMESPTQAVPLDPAPFRQPRKRGARARVWWLIAAIWIAAGVLTLPTQGLHRVSSSSQVPWPALAFAFFLAESLVIHLQFRRDAHSFSMNEVPLVLGLLFCDPLTLITAQLVGYLAALVIRRKQGVVKLAFNVGQFTLQTQVALIVLHLIDPGPTLLDARTTLAMVCGAIAALVLAHGLVVTAIWASGGSESAAETLHVLGISAAGTVMNTLLALGAGVMISEAPEVAWLGLLPPVLIFAAYAAYTRQRTERLRVSTLFEATKTLHRTPQLERAVETTARLALELVRAESVHVILRGEPGSGLCFVSSMDRSATTLMQPCRADLDSEPWMQSTFGRVEISGPITMQLPAIVSQKETIVAPLGDERADYGVLIACDRMGDVSNFDEGDAFLLETLASQLGVSLENGRLADNLAEVRKLKSRLEELVKSKDQLIASVSHELRTPLTGVVGLAQVLEASLGESVDGESAELMRLLVGQGVELSNLIDDLLVQAKAENGSLAVFPTTLDVISEVHAVVGSSSIADMPIMFDQPVPSAFADGLRLRQVLRNLITNSVRYGGRRRWIEVGVEGSHVAIRMCDDGDGVPEDMTQAIFQPYQTAHIRSTQPASVGLGLPVSRTIARLLDGDLTYSRRADATVFTLFVPIDPAIAQLTA
jgi:signal transduction histidine kinase